MTWDYRIIRNTDSELAIHEVYYDKKRRVMAYTAQPIALYGATLEDLIEDMAWQQEALFHPILDEKKLSKQLKRRRKKEALHAQS